MRTERLQPTEAGIARAAALLRMGGTVAFPTETVYGLGANALRPTAIARIFLAKQRPAWDPLIIHLASVRQLAAIATATPLAHHLIESFWPGSLTLLLPRTRAIPDAVTAGRPLVGVRIPAHPVALELLNEVAIPIAAPSANRFGHTSPTTAWHVLDDLDTRIDAVVDGGPTAVGLESTVFDPASLTLYRPGAVTLAMIEAVTGPGTVTVYTPGPSSSPESLLPPEALPSPGTGIRHYAPRARLVLVEGLDDLPANPPHGASILLPAGWPPPPGLHAHLWGGWEDHAALAQNLFAGLRALDDLGAPVIFCPVPQGSGLAAAIRDRLEKAARSG